MRQTKIAREAVSDLSQEALEEALASPLLSWVPFVRFYEETESTNRMAAEWARQGAPNGSLVVADFQSAGRGRLDRSWFSPPGGSLLFSLILRPGVVAEDASLISFAAATAACSAIAEAGLEPRVKWPNDVVLGGRKVAGVLAEAVIELERAVTVVLGLGMNVNIEEKDFPNDLRETATSLMREAGRKFNRLKILTRLLHDFGLLYVPAGHPERVLDAYRPLCETLGRRVLIELGDRTVEAEAVDIDRTGGLVLDTGEVVRAGDVVHLR
jgi:BirA family biotin operon repressor/biotin-[acetyl-CoA-carboxylase] ligase